MYLLLAFAALSLVVLIYGAPPLPTKHDTLGAMLRLADLKADDFAVDLGAGDGRIVIAAAEKGVRAVGYEINPILVLAAKVLIRRKGLQSLASVELANMWKMDLSPYSAVFVFGSPGIMAALEKKLDRELKPGTRIVSNAFEFPHWKAVSKNEGAFLYIK